MAKPVDENGLGLNQLEVIMDSFSCKLWWKIKQNIGVWAAYISTCAHGMNDSIAWTRLRKIDELMEEGTRISVCSGNSSFWMSNWTGTGPLIDRCNPGMHPDVTIPINSYFEHGEWNRDFLQRYFLHDDAEWIQTFSFEFTDGPDILIWSH